MNETNAQTAPGQTASAPPAARTARLRRRATNRVATGVASGLADYLNVDPLLIRVLFVGLVIFNGAGLFIYLAAWLFVPVEGRDASIVEGWIRRIGVSAGTAVTVTWILIGIVGTMALFDWLGPDVDGSGGVRAAVAESAERAAFAVALVVIVVGVLLLRRTGAGGATGFDGTTGGGADATANATPDAAPPFYGTVDRPPEPRDRSPLSFYVLGALLVAVGTLAAVDSVGSAEVLPRHYAALALSVLGLGLVIGAWWGRARWLILLGVVLVPFAFAVSFGRVPAEEGWGSLRVTPASESQLRAEYSLAGGRITLDLTDLPRSSETRRIQASIGAGRLVVILPEGAHVETDVEVGAGTSTLFGTHQSGMGITDHHVREGRGGEFVLDLDVGIGEVVVRTTEDIGESRP